MISSFHGQRMLKAEWYMLTVCQGVFSVDAHARTATSHCWQGMAKRMNMVLLIIVTLVVQTWISVTWLFYISWQNRLFRQRKRIHAPSYYGIFPEKDIDFADVKVDSCYEREDKQPDVIATTADGTQHLIEFTFAYKVQHKQAIDYKNLNCLEIDLSRQSLETVEKFLLESNGLEERRKLIAAQQEARRQAELNAPPLPPSERTCFMCESNLSWMNRPGDRYAHCGCYSSMRVPKNTPPESAQTCRGFKRKF